MAEYIDWDKEFQNLDTAKIAAHPEQDDLTVQLKPCPFCGTKNLSIGVYDEECNYHGELGCDYQNAPYSGLSFGIIHDKTDCILKQVSDNETVGDWYYDTVEEAVAAWNRRTGDD